MLYRRFGFELHYISHAIELPVESRTEDDIISSFDPTARKAVRKILREKQLTVKECDSDEEYAQFYDILLSNKSKHNAKPTHTLEELYRLRELLPENLRLTLIYFEGKPIGGSLLFLCNSKVVLCFYNMLEYEYEYLKPVYLIMYDTVQFAQRVGAQWVDIGVSQVPSHPDPMTPSMGLINFKERFHARGVIRSTYYFKY
jgi:lipid II:glycine glycyltransferase (peptidoglycan interpeptide bridge formation enzyme)